MLDVIERNCLVHHAQLDDLVDELVGYRAIRPEFGCRRGEALLGLAVKRGILDCAIDKQHQLLLNRRRLHLNLLLLLNDVTNLLNNLIEDVFHVLSAL